MSYPYGGGNPGYPGGGYGQPPAAGGYPGQGMPQPGGGMPQPGGYPQQGYPAGGGYGGQPGFGAPQAGMGMPTPESAMSASSGAGGLPYSSAPGNPGALGFGGAGSMPPQAGGYGGAPPAGGYGGAPQTGGYGGAPPASGYGGAPPGGYGGAPQAAGYGGAPPGGYGGAPPASYGAPPAGYGGPPPPQVAMPQQQQQPYQAAPQTQAYASSPAYQPQGCPQPSAGGYAASAPQSYGGGQSGGYGQGAGGMSTQAFKQREDPTLRPASNFSPERDCETLRKAMKGFGTDEKAIIDVLGNRSCQQRQEIKKLFKTMYGKDLVKELKSELGGKFEDAVLALMMTSDEFDASELKRAMKGIGTDEDAMIEILATRSNAQIRKINETYKRMFGKTLESDIVSDTSGHFKRLMVSLAQGGRQEGQAVDPNKAKTDAQRLYSAGVKKLGTDESTFNAILASQSYEQLCCVFEEYRKISPQDIEQSIKNEMSGNLEIGMLAVVRTVRNRPAYFAKKLYESMKGLGTDDRGLIRVVVTRCEVDMVQIKQEFQKTYGKTLDSFIADDTSGDYKRILLQLVSAGGY